MRIINEQLTTAMIVDATELSSKAGLKLSDVVDVCLVVKKLSTDADVDAKAFLTFGNGVILSDDPKPKYLFTFSQSDFGEGKMVAGEQYLFKIGLKNSTDTVYREISPRDNRLYVDQDFIRG